MNSIGNSIIEKYEEHCGKNNFPGDRTTPYFRKDSVLDSTFLFRVRKALGSIPGKMRDNGVMKDYLWHKMTQITFDAEHRITESKCEWNHPTIFYQPNGEYTPDSETIETLSILRETLLQQFADELGLTGTHRIWMNCFGYRLKNGETKAPLPWHDDENNSWTAVTMLTDPNGRHGWTGGTLQLAPTLPNSEEPNIEKLVEVPGQYNSTIFFHNYGTKHTITAITGTVNENEDYAEAEKIEDIFSERIIFCIEDHCEGNCRGMPPTNKGCCILC